jgi:hypothetical protein
VTVIGARCYLDFAFDQELPMTDETDHPDLSETEIAELRALLDHRSQGPFVGLDQAKADTYAMLERKRKERGL